MIAALLSAFGAVIPLMLRPPGLYRVAVAGWIFFLSLGIFSGSILLGPASQLETILFVLPGLPFLLLPAPRDRALIIVLMLVPILFWIAHHLMVDAAADLVEGDPVIVRNLVPPVAALVTFAAVAYQCANFAVTARRFAARIDRAHRASEQSSHAKTAFLSGISHEMRTPLNGVIGLAELIRMEALRRGDPHLEDYAIKIADSGQDLLGVVEKTTHFAELSSNSTSVTMVPVTLKPVVTRVFDRYCEQTAAAGIVLQHSLCDQAAIGNAALIEDILVRLIDNAIRYAGAGATITVALDHTHPGRVHLIVQDTGPGFATSDPEAAFAPFERLNHAAGATFGAGMGLAIARLKAEAMWGNILIDLEQQEGARLVVDLKAADSQTDVGPEQEPFMQTDSSAGRRKRTGTSLT